MASDDAQITTEWLESIGFMTDNEKAAGEHCVRIVGGSDSGRKEDSNDDAEDDEIAELILSRAEDPVAWECFVETYHATTLATLAVISLGERRTKNEVVALCRALKAWAITPGREETE